MSVREGGVNMLTSIDIHAWLDTFLAAASLFVAFRTLQVTKKPKKKRSKRAGTRSKRRY
ncbi:hypothetical protein ERIC2_10p00230 (plasmid) [Paenibacillus larvae subsp. larvae DSM 25430]|uniref:Uncharacterized protein n=1 Tax=Paenibacillus larvae subsp. larvae DSM 25430 TaxID=697284 RepID=V9WFE2_9BACL|nr:hypothetical protein ERIC2_10p00230 [Paenibacillus larvae subsp. larvae DSM 25430]